MARRLRRRLTFANVCSFIALVFALGTGGAYAANTIGSDDIIDESIQSVDIKNGEVHTADLGGGAVTSGKLANASQTLDIPGVDLKSLPKEKRIAAIQKLNDEGCTCGCNLTIARCRVDDPSCPVSLPRAKEIVAAIAGVLEHESDCAVVVGAQDFCEGTGGI